MEYFELNEGTSTGAINKEAGTIKGVSLISTPEAKGHNVKIDQASIESFFKVVEGKTIKAYYTHSPSNEALDSIGLWENFEVKQDSEHTKLVADFVALEAWKEHNKKDYDSLFELAEKAPEAFGVSAEFQGEYIYYDDEGNETKLNEDDDKEAYIRASQVSAFSIVASPSANPTGLFASNETSKALSKELTSLSEEKNEMALELEATKDNLKILSERIETLNKELEEKDGQKEKLEEEIKEWQAKYGKVISEMGAEPVEAVHPLEQKTFEEKLANCKSYSEKYKLYEAEMPTLMQTWNNQ